jgi:predicted DNA repair protein MutK
MGGIYLAYEGTEKVIEFFHKKSRREKVSQMNEKEKIRSAIVTDLILSIEIVIIALYSIIDKPFPVQVFSVSLISILATIGVYGLVALIVRMDDFGIFLVENYDGFLEKVGFFLIKSLPWVIKFLSFVGTFAMLVVAGGIYTHNIEFLHHINLFPVISELVVGLIIGAVALLSKKLISSFLHRF